MEQDRRSSKSRASLYQEYYKLVVVDAFGSVGTEAAARCRPGQLPYFENRTLLRTGKDCLGGNFGRRQANTFPSFEMTGGFSSGLDPDGATQPEFVHIRHRQGVGAVPNEMWKSTDVSCLRRPWSRPVLVFW